MLDWIIVFLLSITPIFELRASIPYGLAAGLPFLAVIIFVIFSNILSALIAYWFIKHIIPFFRKNKFFDKQYNKWVLRTQKKAHKKVEKYGTWGLAIFIGIPLPGSGVWTGALASIILGMSFRNFFKASIIGVIIAAIIVAAITKGGLSLLG